MAANTMRILMIEDEQNLVSTLKKGLSEQGYAIDTAYDGEEGLYYAQHEPYDLIILDLSIPKIDGLTICKEIRSQGNRTPILMLTARSQTEDKVLGLNTGADDYLTKPFSFEELKARINALLRRKENIELPVLKIGNLVMNIQKHEVLAGDKVIDLTPKEFAVLEYLLRNKNKVVTRSMILEHVWDYSYEGMSNIIDVIIASLRKKIEIDKSNKLIHTVFGVGFSMKDPS